MDWKTCCVTMSVSPEERLSTPSPSPSSPSPSSSDDATDEFQFIKQNINTPVIPQT